MKQNMGSADRSLRLLVAVILGFLNFSQTISGALQITLILAASILALTAITGICPLYTLFGFHTDFGRKKRDEGA